MPFLFEKLDVYRRSMDFAERISRLPPNFPKDAAFLSDQMNRAACSIPANIAEGNGRWHAGDRRRYFTIARGSAFECVPLLELCRRMGLLELKVTDEMKKELEAIGAMLTGLAKSNSGKKE